MWWYGRGNSGGSWLPEEKKANMWHGRGNSGGSWPPALQFNTELRRQSKNIYNVIFTIFQNVFYYHT